MCVNKLISYHIIVDDDEAFAQMMLEQLAKEAAEAEAAAASSTEPPTLVQEPAVAEPSSNDGEPAKRIKMEGQASPMVAKKPSVAQVTMEEPTAAVMAPSVAASQQQQALSVAERDAQAKARARGGSRTAVARPGVVHEPPSSMAAPPPPTTSTARSAGGSSAPAPSGRAARTSRRAGAGAAATGSVLTQEQQDAQAKARARGGRGAASVQAASMPGVVHSSVDATSSSNMEPSSTAGSAAAGPASVQSVVSQQEQDAMAKSRARRAGRGAAAASVGAVAVGAAAAANNNNTSAGPPAALSQQERDAMSKARARGGTATMRATAQSQADHDAMAKNRAQANAATAAAVGAVSTSAGDGSLEERIRRKEERETRNRGRRNRNNPEPVPVPEPQVGAVAVKEALEDGIHSDKKDTEKSKMLDGEDFEEPIDPAAAERQRRIDAKFAEIEQMDEERRAKNGEAPTSGAAATGNATTADRGMAVAPDVEHGVTEANKEDDLVVAIAIDEEAEESKYIASAVEYDPDAKPPLFKNRRARLWAYIGCAMLVVIIIIAVVAAVVIGPDEVDVIELTNSPTESPSAAPTSSDQGLLFDFLESELGNSRVYDSGSPHYKAAKWILEEDPMQRGVEDRFLLQRYLLAFLYFHSSEKKPWRSCGKPETIEEGVPSTCVFQEFGRNATDHIIYTPEEGAIPWLSEHDECSWEGVLCEGSDTVLGIELCKFNDQV